MPRRTPTLLLASISLIGACSSPDPGPPIGQASCAQPAPRAAGLVVAGSGSNLALARGLAGSGETTIAPSIGTSGAVAALIDGAIDVGLASRPLKPSEAAAGVRAVPWATCPFGPVSAERTDPVAASLLAAWLSGGAAGPTLFLREAGDSGQALLRSWSPQVAGALDEALAAGRWPVVTTDQEMAAAVQTTPGAVGFLDSSTAAPGLRMLTGSPLRKELSLLLGPSSGPDADAFVAGVTAPAARGVIEAAGCRPVGP